MMLDDRKTILKPESQKNVCGEGKQGEKTKGDGETTGSGFKTISGGFYNKNYYQRLWKAATSLLAKRQRSTYWNSVVKGKSGNKIPTLNI